MARYIGTKAAQAYLDDPRHAVGGYTNEPRFVMDDHFQRVHDEAVALARECFLNMLADAKRFDEDVDGDEVNGRAVMYVSYHITTDESQFRELVDALGIKVGWTESTFDAVTRAIEEPSPTQSPNTQVKP
jgi:3-deoxy-D-arabino-heptulosonate 7-phosphate (DAHP) synthase